MSGSLLGAALALAAAPPETITVTASRTDVGPAASVSKISADDIARRQPATLLDTLDDVAGVRAVSTGGAGGVSFVSIRGGEPNYALVLIDGVRVSDPTNSHGGGFDFGLLDPALVRSVEVSRGTGSAVLGSDALSGTIDIHLRDPAPGLNATVIGEGGTRGRRDGTAILGQGWQTGGALVAGSVFNNGDDDGTRLKRRNALARFMQSAGAFDIKLIGLYADTDRDTFPEDSGGPILAVNRQHEIGSSDLRLGALSISGIRGVLRPNLLISYSDLQDDTNTPAIARGVEAGTPTLTADDHVRRFEATSYLLLTRPRFDLTIGAGVLDERGASRGSIDFGFFNSPTNFALVRTTWSGFGETTLQAANGLLINLAGRYDHVDGGTGRWTGRAAGSYRIGASSPSLFARIGTGFKLPSLYALGHPLVGNAALRPERNRDLEAGVDWSITGTTHLRAAWFDNHFRNLIDFDAASFRIVNRAPAQTRGAEVELQTKLGPAEASGALTYVAIDSPTPLTGRPHWQGNLRVRWPVAPRFALTGAVRFNSHYNDASIPTGPVVTAGHVEGDIGARYTAVRHLTIDLLVRNICDNRIGDAVGFPALGREVRLRVSFGL